jgi:hypothetical protein
MAIPAAGGRFIAALQSGAALGAAVLAVGADTTFDPAPVLGLLIGRELLVGLGQPPEQQGEKS